MHKLHCPSCLRDYPIPKGIQPNDPFKCQCGFKTMVSEVAPKGWKPGGGGAGLAANIPLIAAGIFALAAIGYVLSGGDQEPLEEPQEAEVSEVDHEALKMKVLNAQAEEMMAKGDYEGAVELYKTAPPKVQMAFKEEIQARKERAVIKGGRVLVERLRQAKDREAVSKRAAELKAFIKKYEVELKAQEDRAKARKARKASGGTVEVATTDDGSTGGNSGAETPPDDSVRDSWEAEVAKAEKKVGIKSSSPKSTAKTIKKPKKKPFNYKARPEPAKRIAFFERRAAREAEMVAALGRRIGKAKRAAKKKRDDMLDRARKKSKRSGLNVQITDSFKMENAVIEDMTDYAFTITSKGNMVRYPWTKLHPTSRLLMRRMGARRDVAEDQLQLGYWCLKQRLWNPARKAFGRAAGLDRELRDAIPDVNRIERAATVFNGDFERTGGKVKVYYNFKDKRQGLDFEALGIGGGGGSIRKGQLRIHGQGLFLIALKSIGFDGAAEVNTAVGGASKGTGVAFGLGFNSSSLLKQVVYLVICEPSQQTVSLFKLRSGKLSLLKRVSGVKMGRSPTIKMSCRKRILKVFVRGVNKLQMKISPTWIGPRLYVGGNARGSGSVSFNSLTLKGRVHSEWLRKSFKELNALLFPILRRGQDLSVFRPRGTKPKVARLSAEDGYGVQDLHPRSRELYNEARKKIVWKDVRSIQTALVKFNQVIAKSPRFGAAYYGRGLALHKLGRTELALDDMDRAMQLCPRFYEAMAIAARAHLDLGRPTKAARLAERAVALRPTYPAAHTARGRVRLLQGDLDGAMKDYELARALNPWDEDLTEETRGMTNVIKGPPWKRRFTVKTKNYIIDTNISRQRASEFAEKLEAIRASYVRAFPIKSRDRYGKSRVMVFDTEEGYHAYADLSINNRVEFSVGVYLPSYRQLLLFEPKDDTEGEATLETLYHEGFHQFLHHLIPNPQMIPIWVNEGLAEYFAGSIVRNGKVVRQGAVYGSLEQRLLSLVIFAQANGGPLDLRSMMQESQAQFYSGSNVLRDAKYGHAWTLVHYFLHAASKKRLNRFRKYLSGLIAGKTPPEAFAEAFDGTNWQGLQADWWAHVIKMAKPFLR